MCVCVCVCVCVHVCFTYFICRYTCVLSLFYLLQVFHIRFYRLFFIEAKWQQVFFGLQKLLSIQADLNSTVVWMILIVPLIYNSFRLFSKPLGTIPSAPTTMGITVILMFHSFLVPW